MMIGFEYVSYEKCKGGNRLETSGVPLQLSGIALVLFMLSKWLERMPKSNVNILSKVR